MLRRNAKETLELEKLRVEIELLKRPYRNASFIGTTVAALIAALSLLGRTVYEVSIDELKQRAEDLRHDKSELNKQLAERDISIAQLQSDIAAGKGIQPGSTQVKPPQVGQRMIPLEKELASARATLKSLGVVQDQTEKVVVKRLLNSGEVLFENQAIDSPNSRFRLLLRQAGAVEICKLPAGACETIHPAGAITSLLSGNVDFTRLVMQPDGNLAIYAWTKEGIGIPICAIGRAGPTGSYTLSVSDTGTAKVTGPAWEQTVNEFQCASQTQVNAVLGS